MNEEILENNEELDQELDIEDIEEDIEDIEEEPVEQEQELIDFTQNIQAVQDMYFDNIEPLKLTVSHYDQEELNAVIEQFQAVSNDMLEWLQIAVSRATAIKTAIKNFLKLDYSCIRTMNNIYLIDKDKLQVKAFDLHDIFDTMSVEEFEFAKSHKQYENLEFEISDLDQLFDFLIAEFY